MTNSDLYKNILALSKEIELLIELGHFEKIESVLAKRENIIAKILPDEPKTDEIKQILNEIKAIDEKNFAQLLENKDKSFSKIKTLSRNIHALSSYKLKEVYMHGFVDEKN